jgi:predicted TIM-barrel fold metal-dependent hydrolase
MLDPDSLLLREFRPRQQLVASESIVTRAAHPAIDAHTHLGRWLSGWVGREGEWLVDDVDAWLERMTGFGVHGFVNLDGRWGDELEANLDRFDRAHPGRFATFAHLDWSVLRGDGVPLAEQVRDAARRGAAGLKVWKDLGLEVRDGAGELVLPDDHRLEEMWTAAGELGLPIWWHVADPVAFFQPVDETNENVEILAARPDWSFRGGDLPTFDRLIHSLEAVVAQHPGTTFVAVHGGCYAENLGWVGRMLDTYPHLHIDIAARLAQLGRQPRATRELILRHPRRVLFGTDEIPHTGSSYATHFRFLETEDESFPHTPDPDDPGLGRWRISGLGLPSDVLRDVYGGNARRLVPRLRGTA